MKKITATQLKNILDQHQLWIQTNGKQGNCADLTGENLTGENLWGANLRGADLTGSNLSYANLRRADLRRADLRRANLTRANLRDANLEGANLLDANLKAAFLEGADLTGTILDKKAEKKAEIASVNAESTIRSEIEAIAKKHGMKIDSITLSFL